MFLAQVLDAGVMASGVVEALLHELVSVLSVANDFGPILYPNRVPSGVLDSSIWLIKLRALLVHASVCRVANQDVSPTHIRLLEAVIFGNGNRVCADLLNIG
jgi:hypothetical protein